MTAIRSVPRFDHGAALRVPPPHDSKGWRALITWLGDDGFPLDDRGTLQVATASGPAVARPGDWIVLSVSGHYHVARTGWDA
jgi:hypothetical protein